MAAVPMPHGYTSENRSNFVIHLVPKLPLPPPAPFLSPIVIQYLKAQKEYENAGKTVNDKRAKGTLTEEDIQRVEDTLEAVTFLRKNPNIKMYLQGIMTVKSPKLNRGSVGIAPTPSNTYSAVLGKTLRRRKMRRNSRNRSRRNTRRRRNAMRV